MEKSGNKRREERANAFVTRLSWGEFEFWGYQIVFA